jgi:hypothetical protein
MAGLLERADEIGFEESLDLIYFCLCSAGSSSYVIGSSLVMPSAELDVVDEGGPTGCARMCCRSKLTDEQRQATREAGKLLGLLVGPDASVNGPRSGKRPGVWVARRAT